MIPSMYYTKWVSEVKSRFLNAEWAFRLSNTGRVKRFGALYAEPISMLCRIVDSRCFQFLMLLFRYFWAVFIGFAMNRPKQRSTYKVTLNNYHVQEINVFSWFSRPTLLTPGWIRPRAHLILLSIPQDLQSFQAFRKRFVLPWFVL